MLNFCVEVLLGSPYVVALTAITVLASLVWLGVWFDRQQQRASTVGVKDEVNLRLHI
jgi:hypothetical protein